MSVDHILGIFVILGAYGLTWYLLLKSTRIVNNIAKRGSEHALETEPEPEAGDEAGGDR